ncbi:solute carrier family 2, facilitated glucose transporter member 10 isoform 1-T4 [Spinachia spinachia]
MGSSVLLFASLVSTLGGLVFGYELGIISGALLQIKAEFRLSCVQEEALVSSLLIGALLASILGGWLIDHWGRRNSILLGNVLILTGSLVLLIDSYSALVVGRMTVGFAMCISSMSCCIFVSEVVSPGRRGLLVTVYEAGITLGILAAYAMNYILSDSKRGWKWMFGLAIVPTMLQLVSIWFLPSSTNESSSPRYSFKTESGMMNTVEAGDPKVCLSMESKTVQYNSMYLFQRKDNMRTRTLIGLGLVLFQQFTGQPNVLLYASTIFYAVGFESNASAVLASVGLGLVKVVVTLISMVISDRVGRRPLLISGCSVMALCLITIGVLSGGSVMSAGRPCESQVNRANLHPLTSGNQSVWDMPLRESQRLLLENNTQDKDVVLDAIVQNQPDDPAESPLHPNGSVVKWIILVCMMAVVSAYSVGFGPMTWLLLSEIFPAAIRGRAFAFTNCFNWAANLLVTFTFLDFIDSVGLSGMFLLYGITAVAAGLFFYFVLPETKGKTLEEVDKELCLKKFYHGEECCWRRPSRQYQRVQCQVSVSG